MRAKVSQCNNYDGVLEMRGGNKTQKILILPIISPELPLIRPNFSRFLVHNSDEFLWIPAVRPNFTKFALILPNFSSNFS